LFWRQSEHFKFTHTHAFMEKNTPQKRVRGSIWNVQIGAPQQKQTQWITELHFRRNVDFRNMFLYTNEILWPARKRERVEVRNTQFLNDNFWIDFESQFERISQNVIRIDKYKTRTHQKPCYLFLCCYPKYAKQTHDFNDESTNLVTNTSIKMETQKHMRRVQEDNFTCTQIGNETDKHTRNSAQLVETNKIGVNRDMLFVRVW